MATKRRVSFIIGANLENFEKGLNKAQKKMKKFGRNMDRIGSSMTRSLSVPIVAVAGSAIKASADFERLEQSLSILNRSAEKGSKIFEDLKNLSAGTPFQLQDLAKAQQTLQGFDMTAEDATESIKMIGDVSAVTGGDLQSIATAFGQSSAEGVLMSKDIRQLVNQGVPALSMLADTMGVAKDEIFDLASQGEISFDILQRAFRQATSEGGQFADGMKKQSQTLHGLFSTLRDDVTRSLAEIGESLVENFDLKQAIKNLSDFVQSSAEYWNNLSLNAQMNISKVAGVLAISGPLMIGLGAVTSAVGTLTKAFKTLTATMIKNPAVAGAVALTALGVTLAKVFADLQVVANKLETALEMDLSGTTDEYDKLTKAIVNQEQKLEELRNTPTGTSSGAIEARQKQIAQQEKVIGQLVQRRDAVSLLRLENEKLQEVLANPPDIPTLPSIGPDEGDMEYGIDKALNNLNALTTSWKKLGDSVSTVANEYTRDISKMKAESSNFIENQKKNFKKGQKVTVEFGDVLKRTMQNAIVEFGENLGDIFSGDAGAESFFDGLLMIIADFAVRLGKVIVGIGLASEALKVSFSNPFAAIAAGTALIALGATAKNMLQSGPSGSSSNQKPEGLATGGIVPAGFPNDTFPAMLSSGETVIPPAKPLPNMGSTDRLSYKQLKRAFSDALSGASLKASGSDLKLVLNTYETGRSR